MNCGACGMPIPTGRAHCLYCGASVKYALTEAGTLPYEQVQRHSAEREEPSEPPEPRWDLEGPEGNVQARWLAMRATYSRWAALERRRQIGRGSAGCFFTGAFFLVLIFSCSLFSFVGSQATRQSQAQIRTPDVAASAMTATARAYPNPYAPYQGLLTLNDSLNDDTGSGAWMDYNTDHTGANQDCVFKNGSYTISNVEQKNAGLTPCLAYNTNFQNFAYQISMTTGEGFSGGIVFRHCGPGAFYYFDVAPTGFYGLWINTGSVTKLLKQGKTTAIDPGAHSVNLLAVVADGSTIDLYANHQHLATVNDSTYSSGRIGTAVGEAIRPEATERQFNDAQVWTL